MDQPVVGTVEQPFAQPQRARQPALEEGRIDGRVGVAGEQTRRDQGMRVELGERQAAAVGRVQADRRARRQGLGGRVHAQLVGIGPGMAGAQPPVLAGQKLHLGVKHRRSAAAGGAAQASGIGRQIKSLARAGRDPPRPG